MPSLSTLICTLGTVLRVVGEFFTAFADFLVESDLDAEIPPLLWVVFFFTIGRRPRLAGLLILLYWLFREWRSKLPLEWQDHLLLQ